MLKYNTIQSIRHFISYVILAAQQHCMLCVKMLKISFVSIFALK